MINIPTVMFILLKPMVESGRWYLFAKEFLANPIYFLTLRGQFYEVKHILFHKLVCFYMFFKYTIISKVYMQD